MKKKTKIDSSSIKPFIKPAPFSPQPKFLLNLTEDSLSKQRIKRIRSKKWKFETTSVIFGQKTAIHTLSQIVKLAKGIKRLCVDLEIVSKYQDSLYLADSFKYLKSIQEITFLQNGHEVGTAGLSYFMKELKRLSWIKNIWFYFCGYEPMTDIALNSISRSLKKMAFLNSLHLYINSFSELTDKGIGKLYGSLNRLTKLKNIFIESVEYCEMTDVSFASLGLQKLVSLRKIELQLQNCSQLSDKCFYFLAQGLKGLDDLQSLKLEFYDCMQFSDLGWNELLETVTNFPRLKDFSLVFSDGPKSYDDSTDEMYKYIICSLEEESFKFYSWDGVSDSGVIPVCKLLEKAVSLTSLWIDFEYSFEITDYGLISLCKALEGFDLLQSVHVSLRGCEQISDFAMKELINRIENLTDLRYFAFDFSHCKKITNASLNLIRRLLESKGSSLEGFYLSLPPVSEATKEGMDNLSQQIENLLKERPDLPIVFYGSVLLHNICL